MVKERNLSKIKSCPMEIFSGPNSGIDDFGRSYYFCSDNLFEHLYQNKIFPGIRIDGTDFGGKTTTDVESYFNKKNLPFSNLHILLSFEDKIATLFRSGSVGQF